MNIFRGETFDYLAQNYKFQRLEWRKKLGNKGQNGVKSKKNILRDMRKLKLEKLVRKQEENFSWTIKTVYREVVSFVLNWLHNKCAKPESTKAKCSIYILLCLFWCILLQL